MDLTAELGGSSEMSSETAQIGQDRPATGNSEREKVGRGAGTAGVTARRRHGGVFDGAIDDREQASSRSLQQSFGV